MFYDINNNLENSEILTDNFMAVIPLDLATHYDIINNYVPRIPMIFSVFIFQKLKYSQIFYTDISTFLIF